MKGAENAASALQTMQITLLSGRTGGISDRAGPKSRYLTIGVLLLGFGASESDSTLFNCHRQYKRSMRL